MTVLTQLAPNGEMIAARRRQRGLSRKAVAELVGRSDEWLRQIETGRRRLDSIECTVRLAEILRVDATVLLGLSSKQLPTQHTEGIEALVVPIRRALMDSPAASAFLEKPLWTSPEEEIPFTIEQAWQTWLDSPARYATTIAKLPKLLYTAAHYLNKAAHDPAIGPKWTESAIATYQLACSVLVRIGEHQLAWLAADRAMRIAEAVNKPALQAAAGWHLANCYLQTGRYVESAGFALAVARRLAPEHPADEETAAIWGALHLVAAEAKASQAELHHAEELLGTATSAASLMSHDLRVLTVPFGNIEAGIAAIQVASRLGRLSEAVKLAANVDIPDDYPVDTQVRHFLPLAYVHARRNEDAAAVLALLKTAELSPEDLRYDEMAHQTLARLLNRNNLTVRRELKHLVELSGTSGTSHARHNAATGASLMKNSLFTVATA